MNILQKTIRKLASTSFVATAIKDRADLEPFRQKPTLRIIAGVAAIIVSFIICWPVIALFTILSVKWHNPWIISIGGPTVYGLSHLVFMLGMYLSGGPYTVVFLRWAVRVTFERLLAFCPKTKNSS